MTAFDEEEIRPKALFDSLASPSVLKAFVHLTNDEWAEVPTEPTGNPGTSTPSEGTTIWGDEATACRRASDICEALLLRRPWASMKTGDKSPPPLRHTQVPASLFDPLTDRPWLALAIHFFVTHFKPPRTRSKETLFPPAHPRRNETKPGLRPRPLGRVEGIAWWLTHCPSVESFFQHLNSGGSVSEVRWPEEATVFQQTVEEFYAGARKSSGLRGRITGLAKSVRAGVRRAVTFLHLLAVRAGITPLHAYTLSLYHLETSRFLRVSIRDRLKGLLPVDDLFSTPEKVSLDVNLRARERLQRDLKDSLDEIVATEDADTLDALACFLASAIPSLHFEKRHVMAAFTSRRFSILPVAPCVQLTALYYSTGFQFALGFAKAGGFPIIGVQHGGNYGYAMTHGVSQQVEGLGCDAFVTWGWNRWPSDVGVARARTIPLGSQYLASLRKAGAVAGVRSRRVTGSHRVLFCAGGVLPQKHRLEKYPAFRDFVERLWPENVEALIAFCRTAGIERVDVKTYGLATDVDLIRLLEVASKAAGVELRFLPCASRALSYFPHYELVLWDTLCTGFLESSTYGVTTFLLPSAREVPFLWDQEGLSEKFFLDKGSIDGDLFDRYASAIHDSQPWFERFAGVNDQDLPSYVTSALERARPT